MPRRTSRPDARRGSRGLVFALLALLPLAVFWPVLGGEFVSYDDGEYVLFNPPVLGGLSWDGVLWAFTTGHVANWHPLTWLSHMADVSLFGMNPAGHHATNLMLHVLNTLLLFLLLRSMTGSLWRSAFVAALFAVHPAHVESVAWVAERKDLLCAAFWLSATWAYVSWVRRRGEGRYLLVLLLFAAGLLSKPMIVTLPFTLLLLDVWPLERLREGTPGVFRRLILEKAPLFLLAAASAVVTLLVQRAGGAMGTLEAMPLSARAGNAVVAYTRYLGMLVWPSHLAVFYPHPGAALSTAAILGSSLLLLALTAAAVALRPSAPYVFVGWLWFLVTLLPVIGLVQVGLQALADRYTYVPFIGLFVAVAWGVPAAVSRWRPARFACRAAAAASLLALALAARTQAGVWKNSETLYASSIRNTQNNGVINNQMGEHYNSVGKPVEALRYLNEALRIADKPEVHNNRGVSFILLGRYEDALAEFLVASESQPGGAVVLNNLARTQFLRGEIAESARLYLRAAAAQPDWAYVRKRLGLALLMQGKTAAALEQLRVEAALDPSDAETARLLRDIPLFERDPQDPSVEELRQFLAKAHLDASRALMQRGEKDRAEIELQRALELAPDLAGSR